MSKNMIELKGGGYATEYEALSALAAEARKRDISYGYLVANTNGCEREEIIRAYCAEKRKKVRKRGNGH